MTEMTGYDVSDFKRQLHTISGRGKPPTPVLDWFDDTKYTLPVKNQARMAFETASVARHLQLEYVKEQEELLQKARRCAENAAHLDRIIRVNEQLVIDLRMDSVSLPSYSLGPFFPGDAIQFNVCIASQTPFRAVASPGPAPSVPLIPEIPQSSQSSVPAPSNVCTFKNFPPAPISPQSNESTSTRTSEEGEVEVLDEEEYYTVVNSDDEPNVETIYPAAGFKKSVTFNQKPAEDKTLIQKRGILTNKKSAVSRKDETTVVPEKTQSAASRAVQSTIAPAQLIRFGGELGELQLFDWAVQKYPEKIIVRGILPDGMPEFDYKQVFGQLPPQIEISLELLTNRRISFATRFVVDPTIEENIVQMRVLDEFADPPEPRMRKVLHVPWAYLQGVPTEWTKKAVRVRRYTAKSTEYPPTFQLDVSVTAAKNLRPSIQVLGEPFARKYVVSYAKFDEDDGAIAIKVGKQIEWIAYSRYTPDPPKERSFPFRDSSNRSRN